MKYLTNREWTKQFKFNNNWYKLKSLFDRSTDVEFDFERSINDNNQLFNFEDALLTTQLFEY